MIPWVTKPENKANMTFFLNWHLNMGITSDDGADSWHVKYLVNLKLWWVLLQLLLFFVTHAGGKKMQVSSDHV